MAIFSSTIKSSNLLSDSFLYFLTLNRSGWPKGKDTMTSEKKLLVINFCKCRFSYGLHVHFSGLLFFLWLATMSRFVVVKQKYSFCITIEVHTWCIFSYAFLLLIKISVSLLFEIFLWIHNDSNHVWIIDRLNLVQSSLFFRVLFCTTNNA